MQQYTRIFSGYLLFAVIASAGLICGKLIGVTIQHRYLQVPSRPSSVRYEDPTDPTTDTPPEEVFASVLDKVQHDFVGTVAVGTPTNANLTNGALSRMISSLQDPHAHYLDPVHFKSRYDELNGKREGIGAVLTVSIIKTPGSDVENRYLTVQSVARGSSAEKKGLKAGDRITEIDGQWVIAYPVNEAAQLKSQATFLPGPNPSSSRSTVIAPGISSLAAIDMLSTPIDRTYNLKVQDASGNGTHEVVCNTAIVLVPSVEFRKISSGVLYVKINAFNGECTKTISDAINRNASSDWKKGLIIDLRQTAGGVEAADNSSVNGFASMLDLIGRTATQGSYEAGKIARKRNRLLTFTVNKTRETSNAEARVAVLIDGGTAGLAEIAASCLRDCAGAQLFGSRTFGEGVLNYLGELKGGGGLEIPTAHLFTKAGKPLAEGVQPDYVSRVKTTNGADPALAMAVRFTQYNRLPASHPRVRGGSVATLPVSMHNLSQLDSNLNRIQD